MPVQPCRYKGRPGYKWGEQGKCYTYAPGNMAEKERAKEQALEQGRAVKASEGE